MEKNSNSIWGAVVLVLIIYGLISIMPLWLKLVLGILACCAIFFIIKSFFEKRSSREEYVLVPEYIRHRWDGKPMAVRGYVRKKW